MTFDDVRGKSPEELEALESNLRQEIAALRIQARMGQLRETAKLSHLKKNVARLLTLKRQKEAKEVLK